MTLPHCSQAAPYEVEIEDGKTYFWCTCGLSDKQPFCDGKHKGLGFKSHCFKEETSKKVWLCGCKQTKTPPYCDGSHGDLSE